MAEYYVGGIFWNTFRDRERFDYTEYSQFLNLHGYNDSKKQLYIYLIQYCSYLSWIAAHVTTSESPLSIYVDTLERNRKKYYRDMETFIDNL